MSAAGSMPSARRHVLRTATAADAWGGVSAETFGNGMTGTHTYAGSTGQAKRMLWNNGAGVIDQLDYTYDPLGNLNRVEHAHTLHDSQHIGLHGGTR
ncbi:MAG: hypothetical protein ABI882_12815 [Acidobacteriota bacterium]